MKQKSYRPMLESLEDRDVPSTTEVSGLLVAPSNLTATVQPGQVTLTWIDNCNELRFIVERISQNGMVKQIGVVDQNVTTFTDTDIHGKKMYWYRVYAINDTDISMCAELSQWVEITPGKKR